MTSELEFNFRSLDELGSLYQVDAQENALIRARGDVNIEPDSPDLGGGGSAGNVNFGTVDNPIVKATFNATEVDFGTATFTGLTLPWSDIDFTGSLANDIEDFDSAVSTSTLSSDVSTHTSNTSNPHAVTTTQLGTYTSVEIDSALALKADLNDLTTHEGSSSVHGVTGNVVGDTDVQTLTNKSINALSNSLTEIDIPNLAASFTLPYEMTDLNDAILFTDLATGFSLPWSSLNKAGGSIADIPNRDHSDLSNSGSYTHSDVDSHIDSVASHGVSAVAGLVESQTFTNKTISATQNTITGLTDASISNSAAIQGTKVVPDFGTQSPVTTTSYEWLVGGYRTSLLAAQSGQVADLSWELPPEDGSFGQVLSTNGSGRLSWSSAAGGGGSGQSFTWLQGDPATRSFTHNYSSRNVVVTVVDENFKTIEVSDESRLDLNNIQLSREGTVGGDWTVLVQLIA
jgi:hypothetical protein